ncbi:hypothetical protein HDV03_004896 [Kappamyces sp. JEL0829]|nr:hypothetical protein HDV03_004896 [Kappamyces sp. JEL0829]
MVIFESSWTDSYHCDELPPGRMVWFDDEISITTLYEYSTENDYLIDKCGAEPTLISIGCCVSSLDTVDSFGYTSASYIDIASEPPDVNYYPLSATGHSFCMLELVEETPDVWFVKSAFLTASRCSDGFVCHENGTIELYAELDCSGDPFGSYPLYADQSTTIDLNGNGTMALGSLYTVVQGEVTIKWETDFQQRLQAPTFHNFIEIAAIVSTNLALLLPILFSLFCIRVYAVTFEQMMTKLLHIFVSQFCWNIYTCLMICYWVIKYEYDYQWIIIDQVAACLFNFLTLYGVLVTAQLVLVMMRVKKQRNRLLIQGILVVVHLGCGGGNYVLFAQGFDGEAATKLTQWSYAVPLWTLIVFVFDTVPHLLIMQKHGHFESVKKRTKRMLSIGGLPSSKGGLAGSMGSLDMLAREFKSGGGLAVFVICQTLNTILFIFATVVYNYTYWLGSDIRRDSFKMVGVLLEVLHEIFNLMLYFQAEPFLAELYAEHGHHGHGKAKPVEKKIESSVAASPTEQAQS